MKVKLNISLDTFCTPLVYQYVLLVYTYVYQYIPVYTGTIIPLCACSGLAVGVAVAAAVIGVYGR